MFSQSNDTVSFVDFFRSVNFSSARTNSTKKNTTNNQFYVALPIAPVSNEVANDDHSLIRSYN